MPVLLKMAITNLINLSAKDKKIIKFYLFCPSCCALVKCQLARLREESWWTSYPTTSRGSTTRLCFYIIYGSCLYRLPWYSTCYLLLLDGLHSWDYLAWYYSFFLFKVNFNYELSVCVLIINNCFQMCFISRFVIRQMANLNKLSIMDITTLAYDRILKIHK